MEIRHLAGLICKTLDIALAPKTIKAGFRATGIAPYDPDIFTDADYVQAVERNEVEAAVENELDEEEQRRIVVLLDPAVGHVEEVCTTPEPSTSSISRSTSRSSLSILDVVGPLHGVTPKKPSNRGRKPMSSSVLTSPEVLTTLKKKAEERAVKKAAKTAKDLARLGKLVKELSTTPAKTPAKRGGTSMPAKRAKPSKRSKEQKSSDEEDEDEDFCIICMKTLPKKLTFSNSVHCNECDRPVHLKCADMRASYFTCANCASDVE